MSNGYQNTGAWGGFGDGTPQQPDVEGVRISPSTGKPMKKVTINGENKHGENKSVTIHVDEEGGVFLDSKELAELLEIGIDGNDPPWNDPPSAGPPPTKPPKNTPPPCPPLTNNAAATSEEPSPTP